MSMKEKIITVGSLSPRLYDWSLQDYRHKQKVLLEIKSFLDEALCCMFVNQWAQWQMGHEGGDVVQYWLTLHCVSIANRKHNDQIDHLWKRSDLSSRTKLFCCNYISLIYFFPEHDLFLVDFESKQVNKCKNVTSKFMIQRRVVMNRCVTVPLSVHHCSWVFGQSLEFLHLIHQSLETHPLHPVN